MEDVNFPSDNLRQQLEALGIQPTNDPGNVLFEVPVANPPEFQAVEFLNAEIRHCQVECVGAVPCLISESGNVYEFIRTLRKCIYGKVKHAVRLIRTSSGTFSRTTDEVAVKVMSKAIIEQGHLQENPMVELASQQCLGDPGHQNVLTLVRVSPLQQLRKAHALFYRLNVCKTANSSLLFCLSVTEENCFRL